MSEDQCDYDCDNCESDLEIIDKDTHKEYVCKKTREVIVVG